MWKTLINNNNPGEWDALSSQGFGNRNGSPDLNQTTRTTDSHKKIENLLNSGLCYTGRPRSNIKRKIKLQ